MIHLYNFFVQLYGLTISVVSPFNEKAKKWNEGRTNWRTRLKKLIGGNDEDIFWFHAASLGEAEQGLPVIEQLKAQYPSTKILLSFFSPSGFENFKKHPAVDFIVYLPLDSRKNARDFIEIVNPKAAIFIKYEIWVHYFNTLAESKIPLFLTSALFREDQFYFKKPYKSFFLPILSKVSHIMVQNQTSVNLLRANGLQNISVCGETRIDRVLDLSNTDFSDHIIESFINDQRVFIAGSSWPIEEEMIKNSMGILKGVKIILAPHDISHEHINNIQSLFGNYKLSLYSKGNNGSLKDQQILVIDNIGLLSRIYRYADFAFIGGGLGKGLHSTIEAAVYGLPVIFGPNHNSFVEPAEMLEKGCGFEISSQQEFESILKKLINDNGFLNNVSLAASDYVHSKVGAVKHIISKIVEYI